jgi:hypothetical protein
MTGASVITLTGLTMRLCVPKTMLNKQIIAFAEQENPSGTATGWHIAEKGNYCLLGAEPRIQCDNDENNVHLVVYV